MSRWPKYQNSIKMHKVAKMLIFDGVEHKIMLNSGTNMQNIAFSAFFAFYAFFATFVF